MAAQKKPKTAPPGSGSHETFREHAVQTTSSDRSFGLVFATIFGLIAAYQLYAGRLEWAAGLGGAALLFAVFALAAPRILAPLNKVWTKFGLLLHSVTNPLIMGFIYFVAVTPMGLAMRLLGKDPLRRKLDPAAESYWIDRDPPGPDPDTMRHQF